jgi:uncharacterized protein (TIGR03067 family)
MSKLGLLLVPLVLSSLAADNQTPNATRNRELDALQGQWEPTEVMHAGKKYSDKLVAGNKAKITGDKLEFRPPPPPGGFVPKDYPRGIGLCGVLSITLDPGQKPKAINLTVVDDNDKIELLGIYQLDGDIITICWDEGGVRPESFESPSGSSAIVVRMKRVKEK